MPVSSQYPSIDIPSVDLWTFLFGRKDKPFPDDQIIYQDVDTGRYYTYETLKQASLQFGECLKSAFNFSKGEVLALFTPNSIDTPVLTWGTLWAGGIVSPANPSYTVKELAFQLKDSGATCLATQASKLSVAVEAATNVGIPQDRIILLGDQQDPDGRYKHFTSIQSPSRCPKETIMPDCDLAFLVYSSGTTGVPKGVMLSHRNIIASILQQVSSDGGKLSHSGGPDGKGDRVLAFLPFYHIYGLNCLMAQPLYQGLHMHIMAKFDIEKWCSHVQTFRITFSYIVPPVALLLSKHPVVDKYNLSSLRMMNSAAAPLTRELVKAVYSRIKVGIKQGFGLSEASPTTHSQNWEDWQDYMGSVGRLMPNMEAKYMRMTEDSSDPQEAAIGEVGELYLRGPNIFLGYYRNPTATRECLLPDGWFRTGDVGYQDAKGNFYITDRVKELIKYKGFQVAPAELEGLLLDNEIIKDVAVIGVMSEAHGSEVPLAFVVRRYHGDTSSMSEERKAAHIVRWLNDRVAPHKRLRGGVRFVDEIPRNPTGKILRRKLKERLRHELDRMSKAKL